MDCEGITRHRFRSRPHREHRSDRCTRGLIGYCESQADCLCLLPRVLKKALLDAGAIQFIAAGAAAFLGAQPLLISGVTGPITVFNKTIHTIFVKNGSGGPDFNYLHFLGWVYLWGAILHWVTALFNGERQRICLQVSCLLNLFPSRQTTSCELAQVCNTVPVRYVRLLCSDGLPPGDFNGITTACVYRMLTPNPNSTVFKSSQDSSDKQMTHLHFLGSCQYIAR